MLIICKYVDGLDKVTIQYDAYLDKVLFLMQDFAFSKQLSQKINLFLDL